MRKCDQFSQLKLASITVMPIEKILAGYIFPRFYKKQQMKDQLSYILVPVAYPIYPSSN